MAKTGKVYGEEDWRDPCGPDSYEDREKYGEGGPLIEHAMEICPVTVDRDQKLKPETSKVSQAKTVNGEDLMNGEVLSIPVSGGIPKESKKSKEDEQTK